jgi:hypothetical protein
MLQNKIKNATAYYIYERTTLGDELRVSLGLSIRYVLQILLRTLTPACIPETDSSPP